MQPNKPPADSANSIRNFFKRWPRFYYAIVYIFSPAYFGGLSAETFLRRYGGIAKGTLLNLGSGPRRLGTGVINVDLFNFEGVDTVADIAKTPFADGSAAAVVCDNVLEHVEHPELVAKEITRLLASGGYVYISTPFIYPYHASPEDYRRWTHKGLIQLFEGLEPIVVAPRSGPFSAIMAQLCYATASLLCFGSDRAYWFLVNLSIFIFFPLKYLDLIFNRLPFSNHAASILYAVFQKPTSTSVVAEDRRTAEAFADSWNNLPAGSVYTQDQFDDWMAPLSKKDFLNKRVLELGCGNGSLMVHSIKWKPQILVGVDLGSSVKSATENMKATGQEGWMVEQADLTKYRAKELFDIVYCVGVLHHLKDPKAGMDAVIANTAPGGSFHAWVYAKEGNALVRFVVDPIRIIASRLPWQVTKYGLATPLAVPFWAYAKTLRFAKYSGLRLSFMPLYEYMLWIARRGFDFFRHVAFDQLVTPQTAYIDRATIDAWLASYSSLERGSEYVILRNGNSWKFGGKIKK